MNFVRKLDSTVMLTIMARHTANLVTLVFGYTSPYPMVLKVTIVKYIESISLI
jgi:hypothetical protein